MDSDTFNPDEAAARLAELERATEALMSALDAMPVAEDEEEGAGG